jgi:hypothetical protein
MPLNGQKCKVLEIRQMLKLDQDDDRLPCVRAGTLKPNTLIDFSGSQWDITYGQGWTRITKAGSVKAKTDTHLSDLVIFYREEELNEFRKQQSACD